MIEKGLEMPRSILVESYGGGGGGVAARTRYVEIIDN